MWYFPYMSLPSVLSDPPWRRAARAVAEAPAAKASAPAASRSPATLVWEPGEQERFRGKDAARMSAVAEERLFERLLADLDKKEPLRATELMRLGDEKLAELAQELTPSTTDATTLTMLLGRVGDPFAEHAVSLVRAAPRERGLFEPAMPLRSPDLARNAAAIFAEREIPTHFQLAPPRLHAESWMLRHPAAVGEGLAHLAQAEPGHERDVARAGLAFVASHGGMDAMRVALAESPDLTDWLTPLAALSSLASTSEPAIAWGLFLAARGMDTMAVSRLAEEPAAAVYVARVRASNAERDLAAVPEGVAALPAFVVTEKMPHPTLHDGAPLGDDAVRALCEMLRFSPLARPYAGVAEVRAACARESLDAFAVALFSAWREAGEDPRELWALESCGKIGGDACAREMASRIRSWARGAEPPRHGWEDGRNVVIAPGSREWAFARAGCAVLGAIDTDVARMVLSDLAKTAVQAWLRKEAHRALGDEEADLAHDAVDAPVPAVGLDADGSATFDLGTRAYRVRFNEDLAPYLVDANDARVEGFPRTRKEDDPKKYAAAKEHYTSLAKDATIVLRFQTALLSSMMCTQRAFTAAQFHERFVVHPLLRHLGRRVVWSASPGTATSTFRIAEDGTFADVGDKAVTLGEHSITVAHPILMDADMRAAWATRLTDYQLMQPFPQLKRDLYARAPEEIGEHDLKRAVGIQTSRGRLFQLGRRGWRARFDDEGATEYSRTLPCGAIARFQVTPPVSLHGTGAKDEIFTITVARSGYALERLPPIDYSELVLDLEQARSRAASQDS